MGQDYPAAGETGNAMQWFAVPMLILLGLILLLMLSG